MGLFGQSIKPAVRSLTPTWEVEAQRGGCQSTPRFDVQYTYIKTVSTCLKYETRVDFLSHVLRILLRHAGTP